MTVDAKEIRRIQLAFHFFNASVDRIGFTVEKAGGSATFKSFGIYYDNPKEVEKNKLRSEAGCILEDASESVIEELSGKYRIKLFPAKEFIVTEFPYKGKLSVMTGIMKVYPALNKFTFMNGFDQNGPVMEIYDIPGKKIIYRKEIIRKSD